MNLILEDFTTSTQTQDQIEAILIKYLSNINIDDELIIIDPYFFSPKIDTKYISTIINILTPFIGKLSDLRIVTASNNRSFSSTSKIAIESEIKNLKNTVNVIHTQSDQLHDRYWISDKRQQGIITGTSLNGLGKKYSIVDYLNEVDVKNIVDEFVAQNLI